MKSKIKIVAAVDPGLTGALCVMLGDAPVIYDPPLTKTDKGKMQFDIIAMRDMLSSFVDQEVICGIELVHAMPRESPVASFNFGAGYMAWKMCATCFGFEVIDISPMKWKKAYPELTNSPEIDELREELKSLRAQEKVTKAKKMKADINRQINTLSRRVKVHAKDAARELARSLYPDLNGCFKLKKHDGRAEALLIAKYTREHYNELV